MKTVRQALNLAAVIEKEVNGLPDLNYFGDSNQKQKEQSRAWAWALRNYAQRGTIPDADDNLEVRNWITGTQWSALSDYEDE